MESEFWKCIQIIEKKDKHLLFRKPNVSEKMNALSKLLEIGRPTAISQLVPVLKTSNDELRNAVCNTIIKLFARINSKTLHYSILPSCFITENDLDSFKKKLTKEQYVQIVAIASFNNNGYVREKAVRELSASNDRLAIPFLIYRLADWVQIIREKAEQGLRRFKSIDFLDALIKNIPAFEWARKVKRTDLGAIYSQFMEFILAENRNYLFHNFTSYPDKVRIILAKNMVSAVDVDLKNIKILLRDKHFLIRIIALKHHELLETDEVEELLQDKSAKVRLQVLYLLKGRPGFHELVLKFLADDSGYIRYFARFSLRFNNDDYATLYYENLLKNDQIVGSIMGLAETNGKTFYYIIEQFLSNKNTKIKKAAFYAISRLNEDAAYNFAIQNLIQVPLNIDKAVIDFLAMHPTDEVLEKARKIFKTGQPLERRVTLTLFNKIGGWAALADIIMGTIDSCKSNREISLQYLARWRNKAISLFISPKTDDLARANQALSIAFSIHEKQQFFTENPLHGLYFYLKQ